MALKRGDQLVVANVGDSRCVLCRGEKAFDMSVDHKPEDETETERITKAGGKITSDGRVNGGLNLSRAIGMFPRFYTSFFIHSFILSLIQSFTHSFIH